MRFLQNSFVAKKTRCFILQDKVLQKYAIPIRLRRITLIPSPLMGEGKGEGEHHPRLAPPIKGGGTVWTVKKRKTKGSINILQRF
jgi:hypothetical protein